MTTMRQWLTGLGLERYAEAFQDADVDWDVLPDLTDTDLKELGVTLGHRKKLLRGIAALGDGAAAGASTTPGDLAEGPPMPSPESFTPRHLAERILKSRAALEGERKQVTVLFADIRGSLELIQNTDPEEAHEIMAPAVEAMMEAVHRYEGTVNKVLGDGIMALFGAPIAHEDHAVRACFAALAMQARMAAMNQQVRQRFGVELQLRAGLHSGEVVVRAIGNDLTIDYDAIGMTTHLAARMEQLARPGTTRMTLSTLRL
ncbi:MAG: adenylate/guanylate cyclase domain-containing protein, partial [Alphaproteobacteria bacterium]